MYKPLNRKAKIRKINTETNETYVVDLYLDDILIESRELPGKSIYYARSAAENWENGVMECPA